MDKINFSCHLWMELTFRNDYVFEIQVLKPVLSALIGCIGLAFLVFRL
ncbi:hypothetical protein SBDP1_830035 [Syntrophobacter sp. SbD1]|nr:hypothetical protein SBDP1_830035 [Syntrophobacter sp. SbD1]